MVLKRKKESYKDYKIVHGVFDEHTMMTLYRLINKNDISVVSMLEEGKEAVVLSGVTKQKEWVAIKVYRIEACDFKKMWKYLVEDPRFTGLNKRTRAVVNIWCQREFKNMKIAQAAGVNCPKPLTFKDNVLIMSFIGDNGILAKKLIDVRPDDPEKLYRMVLDNLKKLATARLIHGDLSAYNILLWDEPYFIDFSHGTTLKNQMALELLKRDIKNINSYFSKLNIAVKDPEDIFNELIKLIKSKSE
jgi:RIO kinase 1